MMPVFLPLPFTLKSIHDVHIHCVQNYCSNATASDRAVKYFSGKIDITVISALDRQDSIAHVSVQDKTLCDQDHFGMEDQL